MSDNMDRSSAELESARRPLDDLPMTVLTAGRSPTLPVEIADEAGKVAAAWASMHEALASQSRAGVRRTVAGAGHYIHHDRPEAVVTAVQQVVASAREGAQPDR